MDVNCAGNKFRKKMLADKMTKSIKPPPIFIPDVSNIKALSKDISRILGEDVKVTFKPNPNNIICVLTPDKEAYLSQKKFLSDNNKRFHTFLPRDERAYGIVVNGLHFSTDPENIKEGFSRHSHNVRDVYLCTA